MTGSWVRSVALAAAMVAVASNAASGQAQSTMVRDLVVRGRNAINDLRHGEAAIVSRQILAIGPELTRQQTIDALQILAAAMYPEGGTAQRPDSAKAILRRLVALGVRRGVARDMAWSGIDSMYTLVLRDTAARSAASILPELQLRDSVAHVVALVADKVPPEHIVDRVRFDCFAISFDSLDAALRRTQMPASLGAALRGTCTQLRVEADQDGGAVTVAGRELGQLTQRGTWWVDPAAGVDIAVVRPGARAAARIDLPPGKLVTAHFSFSQDTLPWPRLRTAIEIGDSIHLFDGWTPTASRPALPRKPRLRGRTFGQRAKLALLGAGIGFAVGRFAPAVGCSDTEKVPGGQAWIVGGTTYGPGEAAPLGQSPVCMAGYSAGFALGTFAVASFTGRGEGPSGERRYQQEMARYPSVLRAWEEDARARRAEQDSRVRKIFADDEYALAQIKTGNVAILAGNGAPQAPRVTVQDIPGVISGSMAEGLPSEVDVFTGKAAAPNPGAVGVVIGNRTYGTGMPTSSYATRDALSMRQWLVEAFGMSPERVLLDTNATATRFGELLGTESGESVWALAELVASRPPNSVDVVVFFSGFAIRDGSPAKNLLLPADATADRVAAAGLSMEQLYKNLQALNARSVTVFVDASFSGVSETGAVFEGRAVSPAGAEGVQRPVAANIDVFVAAAQDQVARTIRDQRHGLFSFFLMKGLGGAADANNDTRVTVGELDDYIKARVRASSQELPGGGRQVPESVTNNRNRVLVTLVRKP
jgi:hypothetical protein